PKKRSAAESFGPAASARGPVQPNTPQPPASQAGSKEPDSFKPFSLKTLDGKKKTLKDYANKATLVNFFFPRCPYCNIELPEVQKIYDKYKRQGLSVVWINILPEEAPLIPGWQVAKNLNVPVLIGASQDSLL